MASLIKDPNGSFRIEVVVPDGSRKRVRLGKVPVKTAESWHRRIEALVSDLAAGEPHGRDLAAWLAELPLKLHDRLARAGLADRRAAVATVTVGPFLAAWLEARKPQYKVASVRAWKQVVDGLTELLGTGFPISEVTPEKAEEYRQRMIGDGLRATTVHKRLQHARLMFDHAKRRKLLAENPFEYVRHRPGDASERRAYVEKADVRRVIDHAPNQDWRLLIALSRFAGLRVPSEAMSLRWQDIDWDRGRITVPCPKLEHLAGKGYRVIPLFADVRPYLEEAWDRAPDRAEYVFAEEYRRRAQGKHGWAGCNLRSTLEKIIKRAKVTQWTRLWHSMRASCETDLAREYPLAVVAKWLGNTAAVAMRHYVDVTDADFDRAAAAGPKQAHKAAQQVPASRCFDSQAEPSAHEKAPAVRGLAASCDPLHNRGMEAAGIEPASRDVSAQTSTRVSGQFESRPCVPGRQGASRTSPELF